MIPYNANAERRIDDLIKQAESGEDIEIANQILIEAGHILDNEFNSHPLDSREVDLIRIKNKIRIYEKVLRTYDEIISKLPGDMEFFEHDRDLKSV